MTTQPTTTDDRIDGGITLEEATRTDGTANLRAGGFDAKQILRHRISRGDTNA